MTTLLCKHPEQHLQKSLFARLFQYFRDVGPSHIVGENSKLVGGKLAFYAVFKVLWSCRSPLLTTVL